MRFQFCGELFLGSQLIGQILDVFGDGFDRIADMRELGVVLGLLAFEQGLHFAEQLGAETWLVFDFLECQLGLQRLGEHRGRGVVAILERAGVRFLG
ncbi:hypothetical protein D3C80_1823320 [compost metagenome]